MRSRVGGGPRIVPWVGLARPEAVRNFLVRWEVVHAFPFEEARHLHNPYNQGKPLAIGRDGQEVHPAAGARLVQLMQEAAAAALRQQGDGAGAPPPPPPRVLPRLGQSSQQQQAGAAAGKAPLGSRKAFADLTFDEYLAAFRAVKRRIKELEGIRDGTLGGDEDGGQLAQQQQHPNGARGGAKRSAQPSAWPGPNGAGGPMPPGFGRGAPGGPRPTANGVGMLPPGAVMPLPMQGMPGPGGMVILPIGPGPAAAAAMQQQQQQMQLFAAAAQLPPDQ
jgi:hypothetical protein